MRLLLLNILRKPLRTLLTVFGVGVALFLFCFLETVLAAFNAGVNMSDASRLVVQHKESIIFELPMAYRSRIQQIEGVSGIPMARSPAVICSGLVTVMYSKPKQIRATMRRPIAGP